MELGIATEAKKALRGEIRALGINKLGGRVAMVMELEAKTSRSSSDNLRPESVRRNLALGDLMQAQLSGQGANFAFCIGLFPAGRIWRSRRYIP